MDVLPRISTPPFSAEQEAADLSISTLPMNEIDVIWEMNKQIFDEDRIILCKAVTAQLKVPYGHFQCCSRSNEYPG